MRYNEKTLEVENIYKGKIINLNIHKVILPNNTVAYREVITHPGAVAILPIDKEGKILFVKQFRKAVEEELLEIPAGKMEAGEDPEKCALRELEEETGFLASQLIFISTIYTSPGFSNEVIHIYLAKDLIVGKRNLDEDEFIDLYKYNFIEALNLIKSGKIKDAKTIAAILLTQNF